MNSNQEAIETISLVLISLFWILATVYTSPSDIGWAGILMWFACVYVITFILALKILRRFGSGSRQWLNALLIGASLNQLTVGDIMLVFIINALMYLLFVSKHSA
jgi:hypothetical protein